MLFETEIEVDGKRLVVKTHHLPHAEEIANMWLIMWYADKQWIEKYCPNLVVELGIGGGRFDDHSERYDAKIRDKVSSFSLVADSLGILRDERITHLIKYFDFEDNNRTNDLRGMSNVFWIMQKTFPTREEKNIDWLILALEIKELDISDDFNVDHIYEVGKRLNYDPEQLDEWYQMIGQVEIAYQNLFESAALAYKELESKDMVKTTYLKFGKKLWPIIVLCSENCRMAAFLRSKVGPNAALVAIFNKNGNFHIEKQHYLSFKLGELAAVLRYTVQSKKGRIFVDDWNELRKDGKIDGASELHFYEKAEMIFNGSLTHPNVPAVLSEEEVFEAVSIALDNCYFLSEDCKPKVCNKCNWKPFGLLRCRYKRSASLRAAA